MKNKHSKLMKEIIKNTLLLMLLCIVMLTVLVFAIFVVSLIMAGTPEILYLILGLLLICLIVSICVST